MSETASNDSPGPAVSTEHVQPDGVQLGHAPSPEPSAEVRESITAPAKVMRIGSMVKQLLEEVRASSLDEASRERLAAIYEQSIAELSEALSPDLRDELQSLALPFGADEVPSESELRIAEAQLVGWLEGLFHGIQASLMAQQAAANQQLQEMRQVSEGSQHRPDTPSGAKHSGTYL